jgi:hypothetical protein
MVGSDGRVIPHVFTRRRVDGDESCSPPIYNYARILPWTQNVEKVVAAFKCAHVTPRPAETDARPSQVHEEPVNDHTYPPASYHGR